MITQTYQTGIGIMSGTSLDGLDMALCRFPHKGGFEIGLYREVEYPSEIYEGLKNAHNLSALDLIYLQNAWTEFVAAGLRHFIHDCKWTPEFIACHGHTIFHDPDAQVTFQLMNGALLAARVLKPVVCDFRTVDVARAGQGAPLVPIGDQILFGQYAACLNLGGFANASFEHLGSRIAYDICPVNFVLNHLANELEMPYDADGQTARGGNLDENLLNRLNDLNFYSLPFPKSLGREWVEAEVFPLLEGTSTTTGLRTFTEHAAMQIAQALNSSVKTGTVLTTGGGSFNGFLLERISALCSAKVEVPSPLIIQSKEALIFALLGKRRLEHKINILASATGADNDSIGGAIYI